MYKYLPRRWKLRFAAGLALLFMLIAGLPLMFSVGLILVTKLARVLLAVAILVPVCRILAWWRR